MALTIDLHDRVALVTGASSGIGLGVAVQLAKAGCDVAGCSNLSAESEGVKMFINSVEEQGRKAFYKQTDVTDGKALAQLGDAVAKHFGRIDILISNAGNNVFEGAEECSEEQWQHNLDLNLASHWRISNICKPHLEKNKGVIVIMTSNHAYSTIPGCFPYNVTKTALTGLVRSLAIEWGPRIRTVGVAPGFIDTPGNQKWFDSFSNAEEERQRTIDLHPVKKLGTVEEVGSFCAFLVSDHAAFASGCTYLVDGGRSAIMQDG